MQMRWSIIVLPFILLTTFCHAQEFSWRDDKGNAVPDSDFEKSKDGFGAMLVFTDDQQTFEKWAKPETPKIRTVDEAKRGVPIIVLLFFAGAHGDAAGDAHVTYD